MLPSIEHFRQSPGKVPEGSYFADLTEEQIIAFKHINRLKELLIKNHPNICDLYEEGFSYLEIATLLIPEETENFPYVCQKAVGLAIREINPPEIQAEITQEHRRRNLEELIGDRNSPENLRIWRIAQQTRTKLHGAAVKEMVEARGQTLWSIEEKTLFFELVKNPNFLKENKAINYELIAQTLNERFHNSKEVRTEKSLKNYRTNETRLEKRKRIENSGRDMKKTILWYDKIKPTLPQLSTTALSYPKFEVENPEKLDLIPEEIIAILSLFPENARNRSYLHTIKGKQSLWFKDGTTEGTYDTTLDKSKALTPFAIAPSYHIYDKQFKSSCIELYKLPEEIDERVRKIIQTQGLIHEFAHSIIDPLFYNNEQIRFQNGEIKGGYDTILTFGNMAEKLPPISKYSSGYRKPDNSFEDKVNIFASINEEFAETIAAYLLGFAFCEDEKRTLDPFADRPEIKAFIEDFLNAEKLEEPTL